jgi:hypothetical protein
MKLQSYEALEPLISRGALSKTPVVETCWENERNPNDRDPENLLTAEAGLIER